MTSGPNIPDARRGTERITLRASPALVARLRDLAERLDGAEALVAPILEAGLFLGVSDLFSEIDIVGLAYCPGSTYT